MAEEATVNPDGSTTFETPPGTEDAGGDAGSEGFQDAGFDEETLKAAVEEGVDPAFYFLAGVFVLGLIYFLFFRPKKEEDSDDFFSNLDGEKVRRTRERNMGGCRCL